MFFLAQIVDTVRLRPSDFKYSFHQALTDALNAKFANKIVLNVGLCICFFDFENVGDSFILPGDGASHTNVHFRFIVFRPFIDEVLLGKIKSCTREGILITMGFFDDIFVAANKCPQNSHFNESDQVWVWNYEVEEGNVVEMFMEPGAEVRFRVIDEQFQDTMPPGGEPLPDESAVAQTDKKPSYLILGSMAEPGLGCISWWSES